MMRKNIILILTAMAAVLMAGCRKDLDVTKGLAGTTWNYNTKTTRVSPPTDTAGNAGNEPSLLDIGYRLCFETETTGVLHIHSVVTEPRSYTYAKDTVFNFTYTYRHPNGEINFPLGENTLTICFKMGNDNESFRVVGRKWNGVELGSMGNDAGSNVGVLWFSYGSQFYINEWA